MRFNKSPIVDFESITEADGFSDPSQEETTSNTFVVSTFNPMTSPKSAGEYLILHSAVVGQDSNNRQADHAIEWRLNGAGAWSELTLIEASFAAGNTFEIRTGVVVLTISEDDTIEFRFLFRRGGGGTARIKQKSITIWKFKPA